MKASEILKLLERLAKREDADIYQFSAEISVNRVDQFRNLVFSKESRRKNAIVFLTTYGGDADGAYRLCACLRRRCTKIGFYVFGFCKSAGTLAAIGSDSIVMGDFGEPGPLDVQMVKPDELIPTSSGLDIFQALAVIKNSAFEAFEEYFLALIGKSQGSISAKTAADIARGLSVGLFGPMTGQIDPERLGEVQRAINIANAYGGRLDKGNLRREALDKLVQGYPTHGFVIDIDEAYTIFNNFRSADQLETKIGSHLPGLRRQGKEPVIRDLLETFRMAKPPKKGEPNAEKSKPKAQGAPGSTEAPGSSGGASRNVAQLRRNASGHAAATKKDHDAVNR